MARGNGASAGSRCPRRAPRVRWASARLREAQAPREDFGDAVRHLGPLTEHGGEPLALEAQERDRRQRAHARAPRGRIEQRELAEDLALAELGDAALALHDLDAALDGDVE